jgi:hypothetical protein
MSGNKRNYIRRKKFLMDCCSQLKATLDFVRVARGDKDPGDSAKEALAHAQAIEAVCWSPRARLSAENYCQLMASKTQELCSAILRKSLPSLDLGQIQNFGMLRPEIPKAALPRFPIPIISDPVPVVLAGAEGPTHSVHFMMDFDGFADLLTETPIQSELVIHSFEPDANRYELDGPSLWPAD